MPEVDSQLIKCKHTDVIYFENVKRKKRHYRRHGYNRDKLQDLKQIDFQDRNKKKKEYKVDMSTLKVLGKERRRGGKGFFLTDFGQ